MTTPRTTDTDQDRDLQSQEPQVRSYGEGRKSRWGLDEGDMSLIDLMLERTPTERLKCAESFAASVQELRRARRV